ncbi:MAG: tRNA1(Val) (adenine(37)-N6)-methyltransferase [Desulfuromonas sp.]|nr:tRNA1(Val) (adenine(37)-N6)-methyltransferase [Desulfuromonas sp.]
MTNDSPLLKPDETLDTLRGGAIKIIQHQKGYRFSIDPVLLANFATIGSGARVLDLGCGSGIIALLLARWSGAANIVAVEIQPAQVERAQRNVRLNGLDERVEIRQVDLRQLREKDVGLFDTVVANPPFRAAQTGRCSLGDERAQSRHELAGGLDDFLATASALLRRGGNLAMIHLAERSVDILARMRAVNVEPKRLRMVHSRQDCPARLVLVEGRKQGRPGLQVEPPLFVYQGEEYTDEVAAMYRS